jgi:hypothetical protein
MARQKVESAEILLRQPLPPLAFGGRPKIASQAAAETFAAVVDLDERLLAVIAKRALVIIRHFAARWTEAH